MKTLSNEQRLKMTHAMKIREYPRNVSIITEGDNGQEMFILERGSILVTKGIGIFVHAKFDFKFVTETELSD